jgi:hypothetical protein
MRATPTVTPDVIQEMAARIVERFQPEKIILFGRRICLTGSVTRCSGGRWRTFRSPATSS